MDHNSLALAGWLEWLLVHGNDVTLYYNTKNQVFVCTASNCLRSLTYRAATLVMAIGYTYTTLERLERGEAIGPDMDAPLGEHKGPEGPPSKTTDNEITEG